MARLIVPRLQAFKQLDKHGYPEDFSDMRTWNNTIQKMIDAFELMKYAHSLSDDEERIVSEGYHFSVSISVTYGTKTTQLIIG